MCSTQQPLLIVGASARAAAFSAMRVGMRPWCADLFADADLAARTSAFRVDAATWPHSIRPVFDQAPRGPWLFTGALENRPTLLRALARHRPLWGNHAAVVKRARNPWYLARIFDENNLPHPCVAPAHGTYGLEPGRWLCKPLRSGGGHGIRCPSDSTISTAVHHYLQEYVEGVPCAAIYVADGRRAELLGMTRQLVGEPWLHAAAFQYCGSIGPLHPGPALRSRLEKLGNTLAAGCGLRGLFGVDCILRDDVPWPVEVNPRYTASVEVLEYATGLPALALHRAVFHADEERTIPPYRSSPLAGQVVGKAILFARGTVVIQNSGPWSSSLELPAPLHELPRFADIPHVGQTISAGGPILTFFACAGSPAACLDALREIAVALDRRLFGH
jgi:predicted ATP-grasp superfamily ATP-dependent carboligase